MSRKKKFLWPDNLQKLLLKKQKNIREILCDSGKEEDSKKLEKFIRDLTNHIGSDLSREDVIEFLAQYLVVFPIQSAIFDSEVLEKNYINQRTLKLLRDLNVSLAEFSTKND